MEKTQLIEEGEKILGCIKQVPVLGNNKFPENALDDENYRVLYVWENKYVFTSPNMPQR